jgi:hypothetical protein
MQRYFPVHKFFALSLVAGTTFLFQACEQGFQIGVAPAKDSAAPGGDAGAGGGSGNGVEDAANTPLDTIDSYSVAVAEKKIDVLFVIDNSGSMQEEQDTVLDSFDSFISNFTARSIDFHIGLVTTDASDDPANWRSSVYHDYPNDGAGSLLARTGNARFLDSSLSTTNVIRQFQQDVQFGIIGNGAETGLLSIMKTLAPARLATGGYNEGFVRPDAALSMIVVSDEDESMSASDADYLRTDATQKTNRVQQFMDLMNTLKPNRPDRLRFDAIVATSEKDCPSVGTTDGVVGTGDVYMEVANALKGKSTNICQDFSSSLADLGGSIASQIERRFTLSRVPTGSLIVKLDRQVLSQSATDGYTYDAATNEIEIHGMGLDQRDSFKVSIVYKGVKKNKDKN